MAVSEDGWWSVEVVFAVDHGEVVFGFALDGRGHRLEAGEGFRVVHTLFEQVQFRLADAHLAIHLEQTLSRLVERVVAHRLELQVLR